MNSQISKHPEPHRDFTQFKQELMEGINLYVVPYGSDGMANYGYIIHNEITKQYGFIDVADPAMFAKVLGHFNLLENN